MTPRTQRLVAAFVAFAAALVLGGLSACGMLLGVRPLADAEPGVTTYHALRVDGRERHFLLHLPPAAVRTRVPLVLAFHGYRGNGALLREVSRLDDAADALGFAVAYLDGTGPLGWIGLSWNAGTCCGRAHAREVDDVGFADSVVASLGRRLPVDTAHVFAVGFSAGGMLALRLACARAKAYDAVADVAGAMPDLPCRPARPVSVLLVQGADDDELRFDLRTLRRPHGHPFAHSLEQALRFWAAHDGCTPGAVARDSSGTALFERAIGCPSGREVALVTVADHPHAWPGGVPTWPFGPRPAQQVDASRLALEFFAGMAHAPGTP